MYFDTLPALQSLGQLDIQNYIVDTVNTLVAEEKLRRQSEEKKVLGRKRVIGMSLVSAKTPQPPPWWIKRRRQITAWAKQSEQPTREYLNRYWQFQMEYRQVAEEFMNNFEIDAVPVLGWCPARYQAS